MTLSLTDYIMELPGMKDAQIENMQKTRSFLSGHLVGLNGLEPSTFTMST